MAMTKRPPASVHVPKTAIEQATLALQDLPEKPRDSWSLREAIDVMHDVIAAALDKGYSYEEIAAMLSERGVEIRASSLKRYFAAARKEKDPTAKPRARRTRRIHSTDAVLSAMTAAASSELTPDPIDTAVQDGDADTDAHETLNGTAAPETPEPDEAVTEAPTRRRTGTGSRKTSTRKTSTKPRSTTTRRRKGDS